MRELANNLKFETFNALDEVMKYGEVGDKFYVIVKGVVSVHVPN